MRNDCSEPRQHSLHYAHISSSSPYHRWFFVVARLSSHLHHILYIIYVCKYYIYFIYMNKYIYTCRFWCCKRSECTHCTPPTTKQQRKKVQNKKFARIVFVLSCACDREKNMKGSSIVRNVAGGAFPVIHHTTDIIIIILLLLP